MPSSSTATKHLPHAPIRRVLSPMRQFLQIESSSGIVLLLCTILALVLANSPAARWYHDLWHTHVGLVVGGFHLGGELGHFFINDVLMTIFFFVVGLEIKRELVAGELRDPKKAALPVIAALGGMLVPAAIYFALQAGQPGEHGWGIPMATDIAFVVGVMALLGPRVPLGLKITLLTLAIADDIGAVVVIAIFYSTGLHWGTLAVAAGGFAVVYALRRLGIRGIPIYTVIGLGIWLAVFHTGIHPTIAGVILGLMTPADEWVGRDALRLSLLDVTVQLDTDKNLDSEELAAISFAALESVSPLERLETALHPWVGFVIMPLFALANAGVAIQPAALTSPVALAVGLGLLLGKPVGVVLFSFVSVKAGIARLPSEVNWWAMIGGGCLAGIGFTMSLFIAGLSFPDAPQLLAAGKVGTLLGSLSSVIVGSVVLLLVLPKRREG
jgi:NhaA family Na+:H+ antiporter